MEDFEAALEDFHHNVQLGNVTGGSLVKAQLTVQLLRKIIGASRWNTAQELLQILREKGKSLCPSESSDTVVGNMVRRVMKIVRDEYSRAAKGQLIEAETQESLQKMLMTGNQTDDYSVPMPTLKSNIMEALQEYLSELELTLENISTQALEHIHANEIILTIANSKTVEAFLRRAAKANRKFQVVVVECAPKFLGHPMAVKLSQIGLEVTVITDAQIFSIMARVNKVIVGTHTVTADGGLMAVCGTHTIALAAQFYSVPLYVCTGLHKLCPVYLDTHRQLLLNKVASPEEIMPFTEAAELLEQGVEIAHPEFDYVPANLVKLYITNNGGNSPSYMYRLLSELYHPADHKL